MLRELLGYDGLCEAPPPSLAFHAYLGSNLPNSALKDVLFIAVDIDTFQGYESIIPGQQFHIGVSILDTRSLRDMVRSCPVLESPEHVVRSFQFTIGDSRYCRRASHRFLFGKTEGIPLSDFKPKLLGLASGRDTVLVLHGGNEDLKVLRNLGIDLRPLCIIDTVKAAQHPLQLSYRYSLERLLDELDIPFAALHAAGNDAHFTMRALCMIAARDAERQSPASSILTPLLQTLSSIGQAPRPLIYGEIMAPIDEAWGAEKWEAKRERKAKRAARTERRRLERLGRAQSESPPLSPASIEEA